jgi:hypothetical protein
MHYITEEEFLEASENNEITQSDSELKNLIVEHVGAIMAADDNIVTMNMLVETMAKEFPEFMLAIAEENWIRGYHQGLADVDEGQRLAKKTDDDGVNYSD